MDPRRSIKHLMWISILFRYETIAKTFVAQNGIVSHEWEMLALCTSRKKTQRFVVQRLSNRPEKKSCGQIIHICGGTTSSLHPGGHACRMSHARWTKPGHSETTHDTQLYSYANKIFQTKIAYFGLSIIQWKACSGGNSLFRRVQSFVVHRFP